jgi:hypothetical protein
MQQTTFTPLDITFKRQAVGRFTFDEGSAIPLSGLYTKSGGKPHN